MSSREALSLLILIVMPAKAGIQKMKDYYVYILASDRNGTLYVGVTNDVARRVYEHRNDLTDGFTKRYGVHRLVWFEIYSDINEAILREKSIRSGIVRGNCD